MQNKDAVQRAHQHRVGFVFFARRGKHHVHEVGGVRQIIFRIIERQTVGITVAHGRNRRNFGNQAEFGNAAVIGIINIQAVLIKRSQCANHANHHGHRVGIATETAEEPSELLMHHGVAQHGFFKFGLLLGSRQFAVNQQIAGFQIVAVFSQLLNRIAAIVKLAFVAIDKGDFRFTACRRHKAGVESKHARAFGEGADIDNIVTQGAFQYRQLQGLFTFYLQFNGFRHLFNSFFLM